MRTTIPALILAALASSTAQSSVIATIGQQHFTDGQIISTGQIQTADAGQPAPFNAFIGSDITGPDFSANWTFSYAAQTNISAVSLTLGIYDADSSAAGNQVALFTVNGADLTSLLNTAFEGHGGANSEYDVYSVALPSSTFANLSSGTAMVSFSLQGPGLGVLGATPFNGAELDFSTLSVNTGTTAPEPGSAALLGGGLLASLVWKRRARL